MTKAYVSPSVPNSPPLPTVPSASTATMVSASTAREWSMPTCNWSTAREWVLPSTASLPMKARTTSPFRSRLSTLQHSARCSPTCHSWQELPKATSTSRSSTAIPWAFLPWQASMSATWPTRASKSAMSERKSSTCPRPAASIMPMPSSRSTARMLAPVRRSTTTVTDIIRARSTLKVSPLRWSMPSLPAPDSV